MCTNYFDCSANWGKKIESLEFGLSALHMLPNIRTTEISQLLVLYMLKLLLFDLKIHDMVAIMTEFLYMTDTYELCCKTFKPIYTFDLLNEKLSMLPSVFYTIPAMEKRIIIVISLYGIIDTRV